MGFFSGTKKIAGRIIDVRVDRWMSLDYIKETSGRYRILLSDAIIPKKATYSETFEEAMFRLSLTEEDIHQRRKEFTQLLYAFIAISLGIILYGLYMAISGKMIASLISFCLSLYTLSQAFRFHFWLFQLKNRKLGCTLKEWMNSKVEPTAPSKNLSTNLSARQKNEGN